MNNIDRAFNCSDDLGESTFLADCVCESVKYNISICIHCETIYNDDFYIKIFNNSSFLDATKCCRIKIFKAKYKSKPEDDLMEDFTLDSNQKVQLMNILLSKCGKSSINESNWEYIIKNFINFTNDQKLRRRLYKLLNKIPDYTQLPE